MLYIILLMYVHIYICCAFVGLDNIGETGFSWLDG